MKRSGAQKSNRNYGIDLLRLISMLFVVILHTLIHSGFLNRDNGTWNQYSSAWLLEAFCIGAVDMFAIISGYVGFREKEKPLKPKRLLSLWGQAVFYGLAIFIIARIVGSEIANRAVFYKSAMPVTHTAYWYLTAFVPLFFAMPLINAGVRGLTDKQCKQGICLVFGLFAVMSTLVGDIFSIGLGGNFLWIMLMYFVGAAMKKSNFLSSVKTKWCIIGYVLCTILAWGARMIEFDWQIADITVRHDVWVGGSSPMILLGAILLVVAFSRLRIGEKASKMIGAFAPCAFAVYILNCNYIVWCSLMPKWLGGLNGAQVGLPLKMLYAMLFSLAFFVAALLIDKVRLTAVTAIKRLKK